MEVSYDVPAVSDMFVHYLFSSENKDHRKLLASFISAVLNKKITDAWPRLPQLEKSYSDDKKMVLDVLAEDNEKNIYNIEVQVAYQKYLPLRILHYWAGVFSNQLNESDAYRLLKPVISIVVTTVPFMPGKTDLHYCYKIKEINSGEVLTDHLAIHFLRIPNRIGDDLSQLNNPLLANWLTFLNGSKDTKEQVMEMAAQTEALRPAVDAWTFFNSDEGLRALAMRRLKAKRLFDNELAAEIEEKEAETRRADQMTLEKEAETKRADQAVERADRAVQEKDRAVQEKEQAVQEKDQAVQEKDRAVQEKEAVIAGTITKFQNILCSILKGNLTNKDFQIVQEKISGIDNLNLLEQLAAMSSGITDSEAFDTAVRDLQN